MRDMNLERGYQSNCKSNRYRLPPQRAGSGYTSADAPNVDKSAAAITLRTNMPQNTTRALAMPLSRASDTGRIGSMIIVLEICLPGLSYQVPSLIDQPVHGPGL